MADKFICPVCDSESSENFQHVKNTGRCMYCNADTAFIDLIWDEREKHYEELEAAGVDVHVTANIPTPPLVREAIRLHNENQKLTLENTKFSHALRDVAVTIARATVKE